MGAGVQFVKFAGVCNTRVPTAVVDHLGDPSNSGDMFVEFVRGVKRNTIIVCESYLVVEATQYVLFHSNLEDMEIVYVIIDDRLR